MCVWFQCIDDVDVATNPIFPVYSRTIHTNHPSSKKYVYVYNFFYVECLGKFGTLTMERKKKKKKKKLEIFPHHRKND